MPVTDILKDIDKWGMDAESTQHLCFIITLKDDLMFILENIVSKYDIKIRRAVLAYSISYEVTISKT